MGWSSQVHWQRTSASNFSTLKAGAKVLPHRIVVLDLFERLILIVFFAQFALRFLGNGTHSWSGAATVLLIVSETVPILLILSRGFSSQISLKPTDWMLAIAGATAPLLAFAPAHTTSIVPAVYCTFVMMVGLSIQVAAKLFLGRSFGLVAANRGVKVRGPYRIIRHPMYAGYTITHIGFLLAFPAWWNAAIYIFAFAIQVIRLRREEAILSLDSAYRDFCEAVRYRLVPGVF